MYSFSIKDSRGQKVQVAPIYGEDAVLSIKRAEGEKYCRYDFNGTFTFVNDDYHYFVGRGISESYLFEIEWTDGTEKRIIARANFTLGDMEIDLDNHIATLQLNGKDQYEDFLNKYDAEYDLVQLAPPRRSVDLFKRAFLQIYVLGDTKITNIAGNFEYEVDANHNAQSQDPSDIERMGFKLLEGFAIIDIKTEPSWGLSAYDGRYVGNPNNVYIYREDGKYRLHYGGDYKTEWNIEPTSGGGGRNFSLHFLMPNTTQFKMYLYYTTLTTEKFGGSVDGEVRNVYGRIIHDNTSALNKTEFGNDDIWNDNLNYRYFSPLNGTFLTDVQDRVIITKDTTKTPNKWQSDGKGNYYTPPFQYDKTDRLLAIGWNQWIPVAMWFWNNVSISTVLKEYDVKWTLKDAYFIGDAIKALLEKIDPTMTMDSVFLYNDFYDYNPIIPPKLLWLYITPITNIKRTYYDHAAQRGKITLKQILDMLRTCFKCYWYLQREGDHWKLRIEHSDWFSWGGQYNDAVQFPITYADLTQNIVGLTKRPYTTDQNKYSYDFSEVRSRVAYEWGDKSAEIFNGYPIKAIENFAKGKETEKLSVANFTADIDIIESSPEVLSDDVFVVIGANGQRVGEEMEVYMEEIGYFPDLENHPKYLPQNSMMSFYFLEQNFLNYELSGVTEFPCVLEGLDLPLKADSHLPIVRQNLTALLEIDKEDIAPEKIITSLNFLGGGLDGNIESIEQNLYTGSAEIELSYTQKR